MLDKLASVPELIAGLFAYSIVWAAVSFFLGWVSDNYPDPPDSDT